jgi:hypothetical protein
MSEEKITDALLKLSTYKLVEELLKFKGFELPTELTEKWFGPSTAYLAHKITENDFKCITWRFEMAILDRMFQQFRNFGIKEGYIDGAIDDDEPELLEVDPKTIPAMRGDGI